MAGFPWPATGIVSFQVRAAGGEVWQHPEHARFEDGRGSRIRRLRRSGGRDLRIGLACGLLVVVVGFVLNAAEIA
ncbi:hypothetical protein [Amycolatopsis echigonensis]|uniref:Uncharacterized protein n=1 Tax=Amycolatopsis echigonensis TaxID=2576905 RepID=A0A2N3WS05_9PSEU|nr:MULTISPECIES: hypothetical protein [Amycolatopsis]PKV96661.1 hypothetical protein ATK30_7614 [Amycolatopsis niigatensis]